jgi:hypothetical protein
VELDEVRGELAHRGKLAALALYRELTGAALPEEIAFIDRLTG